MKAKMLLILLLAGFLVFSCHKENSTEPPNENVHPQQDFPWPSLADSPWPMFHHDPQSTGRSPYVGPRKGKIKWIFTPGGSIHNSIAIGPDSTIYFPTCNETEGNQSALYAVLPNGALKWKVWLPLGSESQPMVLANGSILISNGTSIYFINPDDGSILRQVNFEGMNISTYLNIGIDGTLYFVAEEGHLYAVSQQGDILWNIQTEEQFHGYNFPISPDGSTIYIFTRKNYQSVSHLCAIQTDNGHIKWKYHIGEQQNTYYSPLTDSEGNIYYGTFYLGDSAGFYSLSSKGSLIWYYPGAASNEPTIDYDGNLFFESATILTSTDHGGHFRWQQNLGPNKTTYICDREGVVYAFSTDKVKISAIDSKGASLWQINLEKSISRIAAPAIGYDGTLYFGTYPSQGQGKAGLYAIE